MNVRARLDSVTIITVPKIDGDDGFLTVYEQGDAIPFDIVRVFVVGADGGQQRGRHAHKECTQLMVCLNGACEVTCDDGHSKSTFYLESPDKGLMVPPSIWSEQTYKNENTLLMVLCDRPFDENDYIRDYNAFIKWKK